MAIDQNSHVMILETPKCVGVADRTRKCFVAASLKGKNRRKWNTTRLSRVEKMNRFFSAVASKWIFL
jgi:hypothetical protein